MSARSVNVWVPRVLACAALLACSDQRLVVGDSPDGSATPGSDSDSDSDDDDGGAPMADDTLKAHIARVSGMQVSIVTLSCQGECVEVEAVVAGGNPPYAFTWQDGARTALRSLCPTEDTTFRVKVRDTPALDGEFVYEGQTTTAEVQADVLACPDAGPPPVPDAGQRDDCVQLGFSDCSGFLVPRRFAIDLEGTILRKGRSYELRFDTQLDRAGSVRIFGAAAACGIDDALYSEHRETQAWVPGRFCITPDTDLSQITFDYLYDEPLTGAGGFSGGFLCEGCVAP